MTRSPLLRLIKYVRPYVGILLLGVLCTSVYASARMARTYLLKPLLDDVLPAAAVNEGGERPSLAWPGLTRVATHALPGVLDPGPDPLKLPRLPGLDLPREAKPAQPVPPSDLTPADRFWALADGTDHHLARPPGGAPAPDSWAVAPARRLPQGISTTFVDASYTQAVGGLPYTAERRMIAIQEAASRECRLNGGLPASHRGSRPVGGPCRLTLY
jgi:hypothetical protein